MPPTRRQILIYAVLAALVIAVGVRYVLPSRGSGEPAGAKLELAASGSPSAPGAPRRRRLRPARWLCMCAGPCAPRGS